MKTLIEIIMMTLGIVGFLVVIAHADNESYDACLKDCYLDLPEIEECIQDEKSHWDISNTSESQIKRDCKLLINSEKIECQVNCIVHKIKLEDLATKYYDTDVKNFPLTNP